MAYILTYREETRDFITDKGQVQVPAIGDQVDQIVSDRGWRSALEELSLGFQNVPYSDCVRITKQ